MQGAYLSSYQHEGREELLVSTQFESHYARECFPCIDEPEAKATFDLMITIPDEDDEIISNMPATKTVKTNGKTVTFEQTPRMSTYLLAFCIGKFHKKSKTSKNGIKVTTYCTLNHDPENLDFANKIATDSLDFYDEKFGTKYPLKKLDQVAIPDFEAGAMENWGLVTYRESCLLVDKNTSKSHREYVSTVIAHELSHQWFGNLVTMKWWNNLWLNESFATLMEYVCIDAIHPRYKIFEEFFTGECHAALARDALPGVQAVQQDVNNPAEIATLFDGAIVYAKGAHLMFMLYRLMGEKNFFAGIKDYFKTHAYGNTTGDDLWSALQKYADFDVKQFMDAWISQPGYPVITDGKQQRFLLNGATDDTKWPLPEITDDMSGHYILQLSSKEFSDKIANFDKLSLEQKLRLLLDRGLLAKTSLVSSATLLDLIPKFKNETSYPIWDQVFSLLASLKLFFYETDPDFPKFQQYIYNVVEKQLSRLGAVQSDPKEDDNDTKLREGVVGYALFAENSALLAELSELYQPDYEKLNPEARYHILYAKMQLDEDKVFDKFLKDYQNISSPEVKRELLDVLCSAKEHNERLLTLLSEPKIVRPQDHLSLFIRLLRNYRTKQGAISWLYNNWDYVEKMTGEKSIEDYPRYLAAFIRNLQEYDKYQKFFADKAENPALSRALKVAEAEISARLHLLELDNDAVHEHLDDMAL